MSLSKRQQIDMLTVQAISMESESVAIHAQISSLTEQAIRKVADSLVMREKIAMLTEQAEAEEKAAAAAAAAEAARQPEEHTVRLRLDSGESIAFSSKDNATVLCPFDKGQKFKIHRITSGRQAGNVVFEAVGGDVDGMVLDNCTGGSTKLIFFGRTTDRNNCQHWKYADGKISSVKGGRQIKVGGNGRITFAKEGEEGDTFSHE